MIAYVDTSALLRLVLREPDALEDLRSAEAFVSSEILVVETLRTIDRLRLQGGLSAEEAAFRRALATEWLKTGCSVRSSWPPTTVTSPSRRAASGSRLWGLTPGGSGRSTTR